MSRHTGIFSATAMFARYRETLKCHGKESEFVLFTRIGRGTKRFLVNNVHWGLLDSDSKFECGDIVYDQKGNQYFLVAKTNSMQGDKGEFYKTNCKIDITRVSQEYDEYDNPTSNANEEIYNELDCVYEDISAHMYLYDYGLLKTTTKRFILPSDTEVKLQDRIILNGQTLKVDDINTSDFAPFLYVQCSEDNRR